MYKDKNGWPIDLDKFVELMADPDYKRVDLTEVNGYRISTVWTGLHFETMVFTPADEVEEDLTRRHDTLMQAKAGHLRAVRAVEQMEAAK